ncbi:MAG: NAD-dependent isocitrate dehydrogenase, partial [Bacteroidetes bacterium]|nr:NAD-dependent isocitrate dehydrogenase [Bacteroidota bacterium]
MTNTIVTLIKGDGIGPEITDAVKRIVAAANVPIEWDEENAGQTTLVEVGELIPASLIESIKKNKVALKGPLTTPGGKGFMSVIVQLRQLFY